jgi:hypothetical protein
LQDIGTYQQETRPSDLSSFCAPSTGAQQAPEGTRQPPEKPVSSKPTAPEDGDKRNEETATNTTTKKVEGHLPKQATPAKTNVATLKGRIEAQVQKLNASSQPNVETSQGHIDAAAQKLNASSQLTPRTKLMLPKESSRKTLKQRIDADVRKLMDDVKLDDFV